MDLDRRVFELEQDNSDIRTVILGNPDLGIASLATRLMQFEMRLHDSEKWNKLSLALVTLGLGIATVVQLYLVHTVREMLALLAK